MSDPPIAKYHFLAWARRGIAATISNPDQSPLPRRAALSVQLSVSAKQGDTTNVVQPGAVPVELYGPGDIVGFDPRHIVRTEPRNNTPNFEPNYLCEIEFDGPDVPWMFTPAAPKGDRLRPWLALLALKPGEFRPSGLAPTPLPSIEILTAAPLHDLSESWNWAHVQVSGDIPLGDAMNSARGTVISRLLCPRRLDPEIAYTAFLVPAFEIGRMIGLGKDVSGVSTADPAWTSQTPAPLVMPFYYQFFFTTSDAGDFESLVRRLTPRILPAGVGERPMDVSHPASGISSAGPPLGLEGALESFLTKPTAWNDPEKTAFQTDTQNWINQTQAATDDPASPNPDDPIIAPPIYGRWHAAVQSVDRTAAGWVNELNLDPRNRSGSGMGTQVVQKEPTQLMAAAWEQVDGIRKANQMLYQAQLARAALQQVYRHQLQPAATETLVAVTAPLHARLMASPVTIRANVRASRVPERMLSAAFRRVTRPRRRRGASPHARPALLTRINSGELAFLPPPKAPNGLVSIEQVSDQVAPPATQTLSKWWRWIVLVAVLVLAIVVAVVAAAVGAVAAAAVAAVAVAVGAAVWSKVKSALQSASATSDLRQAAFTPQTIASVPARPTFQVTSPGTPPAAAGGTTTAADSAAAAAFRSATSDLFTHIQALPADPPQPPSLAVADLKTTLLARLDPSVTVPRRMQALISLSSIFVRDQVDPLDTIMAAPDFPQAMYGPLRDLSTEYILPGVELILPDTVGLLQTNHKFIESYMVGLNYEMGRQLLWNDYPTDQRGSYFRQFWDVSAYVPTATDPTDPAQLTELLKDIPPIHAWPKLTPLGQHPNRTDIVLNNVVLLVRGELFRRYPNAIVYAGKAVPKDGKLALDETAEKYPIFRGVLPADITFLGFNLSEDDARGGTAASPNGYYFVFQEQPSEPRFGLEPNEGGPEVTQWSDLAWTNFGGSPDGGPPPPRFQMPNLGNTVRGNTIQKNPWRLASQVFNIVINSTAVPDTLSPSAQPLRVASGADFNATDAPYQWGVNSAHTAYILLRLPFRVLIHASLMLPPKS
jgi:hypothetical protein